MLALEHDRSLVITVTLVTSEELGQMIFILRSVVIFDRNIRGCGTENGTGLLRNNTYAGVNGCLRLHTRANHRRLRSQKRHCLTLHVGSHQRTVGVIVLKERNKSGRYREHHLRGYVHVVKHMSLIFLCLLAETTGYILVDKMSLCVQGLVRLSHMVVVFLIRRHVDNFISYYRILGIGLVDLAVRSLNETVLVDPCIGRKRVDQTDVGTFRGLDGTHTSIVRIMNVADLESGAVSGQTSGSQGGQTSLVGQLAQRVVLIHEL